MTENLYITNFNKSDHTRFGGIIYISDFNTEYKKNNIKGSTIAYRIANDLDFDKECKENLKTEKSGGYLND